LRTLRWSSSRPPDASPTPRFSAPYSTSPLRWIRSERTVPGTRRLERSLSTRICDSVTDVMSSPLALSITRTCSPASMRSAMPLSVMYRLVAVL
jgi:hypothetical protein